ncbi:hypothetical protein Q5Y75_11620 [Ruegeria sp. 2205SS24-7]|uniref:hypothetical protein n=1 Tax=Ruegeria discodermiae TaxID=3064389 RepID=UPI0027405354|nr:hypothetical protein [Ruegeria sp. 2205SS24-7]MDP5217868.1 hypothetical protein [Ruegeria sp. 2205SS24-7]
MTLILSVQTRGSIWLVADRRLSGAIPRPIDDAIKLTVVQTTDGLALLGYAGLGATALGSNPSQWVSNVLRGRNCPLEEMLGIVADAMKREFPPHLTTLADVRQRQHNFLVPAFVGNEYRVYTIELVATPNGWWHRYTRHVRGGALAPSQITVPIVVLGSGERSLVNYTGWERPLVSLVNAYNRNKVSALSVSNRLAELCYHAHQNTLDGSVGPRSIVVWRNSMTGSHTGGGGQNFYTGLKKDEDDAILPCILKGMDLAMCIKVILSEMSPEKQRLLDAFATGQRPAPPKLVTEEIEKINDRLAKLPNTPNEKLR